MLWALAPPIVHELGHYVAAILMGSRLSFTLSWAEFRGIKIPRATWKYPTGLTKTQLKILCQAGFVGEFLVLPLAPWPYAVVALLHFVLYPHYAKDFNDFIGMV